MKPDLSFLVTKFTGVIGRQRVAALTVLPGHVIYERAPHQQMLPPGPADTCPCEAWQTADLLWVAATEDDRQAWRNAVLRPGISGYDLWMGWNAWCFNRGLDGPATPPPSGGYAYDEDFCGGGAQVPEICKKPPVPPPWPPGEDCPHCTHPNPMYLALEAYGFAGDLDPINGSWLLTQSEVAPCHFIHVADLWLLDIEFHLPGAHLTVLEVADLTDCAIPLEGMGVNYADCSSGTGGAFFTPDPELCPIPQEWYNAGTYNFEGSEP